MSDVGANGVRVETRRLRSAIEFAVAIANAGQRLRPPIPFPADLKPFLKASRIPASELGRLRRAIEADDSFRRRLGTGALPELVDDIGREWLQRTEGWQERIAALVDAQQVAADAADAAAELRRAEKRRDAAEQATARTRAELIAVTEQLAEVRQELAQTRAEVAADGTGREQDRRDVAEARTAARHAEDRARAATERMSRLDADLAVARAERDALEAQRDALLAERAERSGVGVAANDVGELRQLAESARRLATQLGAIVTAPTSATRRALALPGGVSRDSVRASEMLLRSGGLVLIDGYNVSMGTWPDQPLEQQRERLLDLADDVARRYGTELVVVFDGADIVGAHGRRRMVRVRYSPAGVTADDVIRGEVAAVPIERPVVVVTDDNAVRRDVAAAGANLITSPAFVAVARGDRSL